MNKLGAGVCFCMLSGVMECARYITAGIYMAGGASQSSELFSTGLDYVGIKLELYAAASLCLGMCLMIWDLKDHRTKK